MTFFADEAGFDLTLARTETQGEPFAPLPLGVLKPNMGLGFALTAILSYNKSLQNEVSQFSGLSLQYRATKPDASFHELLVNKSSITAMEAESQLKLKRNVPSASGASNARVSDSHKATEGKHAGTRPGQKMEGQESEQLAAFSDLSIVNLDLISLAKMNILVQCLLSSRVEGSDNVIQLDAAHPDITVKIEYASHSCVVLESSNAGTTLRAAVGIETCKARGFCVRVLTLTRAEADPSQLPLPEELPWTHEIVKLLDSFITTEVSNVDWALMKQVTRQLLAALTFGLPALPVLSTMLNPQPDAVINANKSNKEPVGTPLPSNGPRPGGKFGLSIVIRAQKASAANPSRGLSVLALSHLRLRLFVGETNGLDLLMLPGGMQIIKAEETEAPVVPYNEFAAKLKKMVADLLG